MLIEVYADVVCVWAYIGKRRLEAAIELIARSSPALAPVEVVWRPFLIDPMAPVPSRPLGEALRDPTVDAALAQCAPGLSAADNRVRVRNIARAEGTQRVADAVAGQQLECPPAAPRGAAGSRPGWPGMLPEVQRLRLAESLLDLGDPLGALFLLDPCSNSTPATPMSRC